jgi:hypothetical protein
MIMKLLRRVTSLLATPEVPRVPPPCDHAVHFYAHDEALLNQLEDYVLEGARQGDVTVVIATPQHRQDLRDRLACYELEDAFLGLDAAEMLARFMVDGLPDPVLFERTVGALLRSRIKDGKVRAYGEMVALLWAEDNVAGTYALEELWNELQQEVAFPLLCAYPLRDVADDLGPDLATVCRLHTHVHRLAA